MIKLTEAVEKHLHSVAEISSYLWERGWTERNGGNISINLSGLQEITEAQLQHSLYIRKQCPRESAGMVLFVTGTGERIRDLRKNLSEVSCILKIDDDGSGYYIIWGGEGNDNIRPTSEFISHIQIHLVNRERNPENRCVVHAHPQELIAISYYPEFLRKPENLTKVLWSMLPEVRLYVPLGVSMLPYILPGSEELAARTAGELEKHDVVIWQKHGALACGTDARETFDLLDVANKGACIFLLCLQSGFIPAGLTETELDQLENVYLSRS